MQIEQNPPVVTIEMAGNKTMKVELYPAIAPPNTVYNFISLVRRGGFTMAFFSTGSFPGL